MQSFQHQSWAFWAHSLFCHSLSKFLGPCTKDPSGATSRISTRLQGELSPTHLSQWGQGCLQGSVSDLQKTLVHTTQCSTCCGAYARAAFLRNALGTPFSLLGLNVAEELCVSLAAKEGFTPPLQEYFLYWAECLNPRFRLTPANARELVNCLRGDNFYITI